MTNRDKDQIYINHITIDETGNEERWFGGVDEKFEV